MWTEAYMFVGLFCTSLVLVMHDFIKHPQKINMLFKLEAACATNTPFFWQE